MKMLLSHYEAIEEIKKIIEKIYLISEDSSLIETPTEDLLRMERRYDFTLMLIKNELKRRNQNEPNKL